MIRLLLILLLSACSAISAEYFRSQGRVSFSQRVTITVSTNSTTPAPTADLLWWKLNDGSGTTFTATVGPNGSAAALNGWTTGANTVPTSAAKSSGDDAWTSGSALTYGTEVSVSMWVKDAGWNTGSYTPVVIQSDTTYNDINSWYIYSDEGPMYAVITGTTGQKRVGLGTLSNSAWHHVVVTMDADANGGAGDVVAYVDGANVTSLIDDTKTGTSVFGSDVLSLAKVTTGIGNFYSGEVDDLRIYSSILTSGQVSALYASPE